MVEPPRMIAKSEWRCLTDLEICALAVFHKSMGDAMEISVSFSSRLFVINFGLFIINQTVFELLR